MNKELFVQNIKFYCARKNVKPTVACREAGVSASFISNIEGRGQTPSVEKVEMLAHYLGVTVSELLGEAPPPAQTAVLRDSAVVVYTTPRGELTPDEFDLVIAYRKASQKEKKLIDSILDEYKKSTTSNVG